MYGGSFTVDNLTILCRRCNERQGNRFWDHLIPLCREPDFEEILFDALHACAIEISETGRPRVMTWAADLFFEMWC
jgi:5-methylcytosine-specific restriction endonuclease McrA